MNADVLVSARRPIALPPDQPIAAPSALRRIAAKTLFWPTLTWNLLWWRGLGYRRWWDVVDETLILGGLPLAGDPVRLHELGIRGVINLCHEFDGPSEAYAELQIEQLHLPIVEYTSPTGDEVRSAMAFLDRYADRRERVYLHCKVGRSRSATIALCWMIKTQHLDPVAALARLRGCRPQVSYWLANRAVVQEFAASLEPDH